MNEKAITLTGKKPHNVILENRTTLTATGIQAILSYDELTASLDTEYGMLTIGGEGLKAVSYTHLAAASDFGCRRAAQFQPLYFHSLLPVPVQLLQLCFPHDR